MSVQDLQPDLETTPEPDERVMRRLVRALDYSKGFWLGFAKSNTPAQRRRLAALCRDLLEPLKIRVLEIELNEPVTDLLPVLREHLAQETAANDEEKETRPKLAIFVHGLERSIPSREAYPPLLSALNLKRELFRQEVPHPLLLWLPDYALTALARKAPDFWAWRSGLYEFAPEREAAEQSLEIVHGETIQIIDNLSEQAKRERLVMLKGLLEDYLELGDSPREQEAQARILNNIGLTYHGLSEWTEAEHAYEESLNISRSLEDDEGAAVALNNLALVKQELGDIADAWRLCSESLAIKKKLSDRSGVSTTLHNLAMLAWEQGDLEEARRLYAESLVTKRELGDMSGVATTLHELGRLARAQGDWDEARRYYEESVEIKKVLGDQSGIAITLHALANLALVEGDLLEAHRLYNESLEITKRLGDKGNLALIFVNLGLLSKQEGNMSEAARLFYEALSIFERLGSPYAEKVRQLLTEMEDTEDVIG